MKPFVIAIAGTSGAGKTTIVNQLSEALAPASVLMFDDYENENTYPKDFSAWLDNGADPNALTAPQFAQDVATLRQGVAISHIKTGTIIQPNHYVILEEPLGNQRDEVHNLIDFVVYLDLPLGIALARRVKRTLKEFPLEMSREAIIDNLSGVFSWYEHQGHMLYHLLDQQAKSTSHYKVDARQPIDAIIEEIVAQVKAHQS